MTGSILAGMAQDATLADVMRVLEQIRSTLGYNNNGAMVVYQGGPTNWAISGAVTISGTPAVAQSGTWTVQPGNTANTTAWLTTLAASSTTLYGPQGFALDQHYQSIQAFDAIRTKITVS